MSLTVFGLAFIDINFWGLRSLVAIYAAVDQGLSDRIAAAIGANPVKPLQVKPVSEAEKFRPNLG